MAFGLAAFRLVPATWETRWVKISAVLSPEAYRGVIFSSLTITWRLLWSSTRNYRCSRSGIAFAVVAASILSRKFRPDAILPSGFHCRRWQRCQYF